MTPEPSVGAVRRAWDFCIHNNTHSWDVTCSACQSIALDAERRAGAREAWEEAATFVRAQRKQNMNSSVDGYLGWLEYRFHAFAAALETEAPHE